MAKRRKRRELNPQSIYERSFKEVRKAFTRFYNYKQEWRIIKTYEMMAKRADQRLVRLEQAARSDKKYENILGYAYRRAQRDIRAWDQKNGGTVKENPRFNRNMPMRTNKKGELVPDIAAIKSKMTDIERFLLSATSTVKGTVEVYEKRADILNESAGVPKGDPGRVTWEDMYNYYASVTSGIITEKAIGYNTLVSTLASIKRETADKTPAEIKAMTANMHTKWSKDKNVNTTAKQLLDAGLDPNLFYRGNA